MIDIFNIKKKIGNIIRFLFMLSLAGAFITQSVLAFNIYSDSIPQYNSNPNISLNVWNDWASTGNINDDLVFSDFSNNGDVVENGGAIMLVELSNTFTNLYEVNLNNYYSSSDNLGKIRYNNNYCGSTSCYIGLSMTSYGQYAQESINTLNYICDELDGSPYISHTTLNVVQKQNNFYLAKFSWSNMLNVYSSGTSKSDGIVLKDISCGNQVGYKTSETLIKSYTTTKQFDKFTLTDTKILNGGTITPKLKYLGTEYSFNNGIVNLVIPQGASFELKYYINGNGVNTPQLSNINLVSQNTAETPNTEMFYTLNGGTKTSICVSELNCQLNLTAQENANSIVIELEDENGVTSVTKNFVVDTTEGTQTNNIPGTIETYTFTGLQINISETNPKTCLFNVNEGTNFTCSTSSVTFPVAGNNTFNIFLEDLAGNTNNYNYNVYVNPKHSLKFTDISSSIINNYTLDGVEMNGIYLFNTFDYGFGNHTLTFLRDGFVTTEFKLVISNTSNINTTIQVPKASLFFELKDLSTKQLINTTMTFELSGKSFSKTTTSNGTIKLVDNMLKGDYTVLVVDPSNKYESKEFYFTFDGRSAINKVGYFLELNGNDTGYVTIQAKDFDGGSLKYKRVFAKQLDAEKQEYIMVQEAKTAGDGTAEIKVILEKAFYIFCIELDSGNVCSEAARIKITENGKIIPLAKETYIKTDKSIYEKVRTSLDTFDYDLETQILTAKVLIDNHGQEEGNICFKIVKIDSLNNREELTPYCKILDSLSIDKTYQFQSNNTYEWYSYISQDTGESPLFKRTLNETPGFWEMFAELSLKWILLLVLGIVGISSLFWADSILPVLLINLVDVVLLWTYFDDIVSPEASSAVFVMILLSAWVIKE